jgi:flagellar biosynthesis/type III secretory pathway protein FliH
MYESPITQILGEMQTQYENDCMKVVQQCGFDVNKEELIKALQYDRNQYSKGYDDGYNKAIDDFTKEICKKYTEEERKQNFKQYCHSIKQELADLAQQLKAGGSNE